GQRTPWARRRRRASPEEACVESAPHPYLLACGARSGHRWPMHRTRTFVTTALAIAGAACIAFLPRAWAAPPPASNPPASAPSASAPSVAALPPPLVENDEMLQPLPVAPHLVATWDEALSALRARSTDLRLALDEI